MWRPESIDNPVIHVDSLSAYFERAPVLPTYEVFITLLEMVGRFALAGGRCRVIIKL